MSANQNAGGAAAAPRAPYGSGTILRVGMQLSAQGGAPQPVAEDDLLRILADLQRFWSLGTAGGHDAFLHRLRSEVCRAGRPDEPIPDDLLWERHAAKLECISAWFAGSTVDFAPAIARAQQVCAAVRALGEACASRGAGGAGPEGDALLATAAEGEDDSDPKPQEVLYRGVLHEMHKERVCRWGEDTYRVVYASRNVPDTRQRRPPDAAAGDAANDDDLSDLSDDDDDLSDGSAPGARAPPRRMQFDTRSMCRAKPVRVYVNETCSRIITNPELYRVSVSAGDVNALEKVVKRIVGTDEVEGLAHYRPQRTVFSFQNCALDVEGTVRRIAHDDIPLGEHAANYFDSPLSSDGFTAAGEAIPEHPVWATPALDRMLHYQGITGELYRVFTALCIGRLCFNLNTKHSDNWQVVPLLLGQAGTGKSTIVEQIVYRIYGKDHCGIIPNKANSNFMGFAFENKHLWVCSEVTQECTWDQSLFQQIVSGETFASERKFRDLKWVESTFPGIMCSNTGLPFMDTMGSIERRIVCFFYDRKVAPADQDSGLQAKIRDEFSRILVKSVANYHWLRGAVQAPPYNGRLWAFLNARHGNYFERGRMKSLSGTTVLNEYLYHAVYGDRSIVRDPSYYIEFETFKRMAEHWCDETNRRKPDWVLDTIKTALSPMNASFDGSKTLRWPPTQQEFHTGKFILGIGLKDHALDAGRPISWTPLQDAVGLHVVFVSGGPGTPGVEVFCEMPGGVVARLRAEHPASVVRPGEPSYEDLVGIVRDRQDADIVPPGTQVHEGPPPHSLASAAGVQLGWLTRVVYAQ